MNDTDIAEMTGLAPARVRDIRRDLDEGTHWKKAGREVEWTQAGLDEVQRRLDLDEKIPAEKKGGEEPKECTLVVARLVANPRLVLCSYESGGPAVARLVVRTARNFRPGMTVDRCKRKGPDLYVMGRNCPRFPGRW